MQPRWSLFAPRFRFEQNGEVLAKDLRAVKHQLLAAAGGKICACQPDAKNAASTEARSNLLQRPNVTSFDARWQAGSKLNQTALRTDERDCLATPFPPASPLHYALTLRQSAEVWSCP